MSCDMACLVGELWEDLGRLYEDVLRIQNDRDAGTVLPLAGEKNDAGALVSRFSNRFCALHMLAAASMEMNSPENPEAMRQAAPMSDDIANLIEGLWEDLGRLYDEIGQAEDDRDAIERLLYPDRD